MNQRQRMLREFLTATRDDEFVYGLTDCCKWVAAWVKAMTGTDYANVSYDAYTCDATIRSLGGFEGYATQCLGAPIASEVADDGDLALATLPVVGPTFVIVAAHKQSAWGKKAPRGLIEVPLRRCEMAWSVPCLR